MLIPLCGFVCIGLSLQQSGKLNISQQFQDWSCSSGCSPSQHCRLPRCTNVVFPDMFKGSGKVTMLIYSMACFSVLMYNISSIVIQLLFPLLQMLLSLANY